MSLKSSIGWPDTIHIREKLLLEIDLVSTIQMDLLMDSIEFSEPPLIAVPVWRCQK